MILEQQKQANVLSLGEDNESIEMSIDMSNMKLLMEMFSRNIYSDAIGSTIRETVSNALDSSRRAGSTEPVIVSLNPLDTGEYEYSVEDFGLGLDDVEVKNIISKYMASTKRESSTELGYYGVGFKSPLAYSSSFTFICRKNGIERKYMMYEGEEVNSIDLLNESPTDKSNGVKVILPVKYGDRSDFVMKIKEQLAYFDNVYFNVNIQNPSYSYQRSEYAPKTINNDFIIHRSEDFQWSEMSADKSLHMCLDNVYYPIDFEKLGINRIDVPIALKFGLSDGLFPTINREAIRYTPETKAVILDKIRKVADYFMDKYNESITDAEDLQQVINYYRDRTRYVELETKKFNVKDLLSYSSISEKEPKMKNIKLLSLKRLAEEVNHLFDEYKVKFIYSNNRMTSMNNTMYYSDIDDCSFYKYDEPLTGNKKLYIREIIPNGTHIIKKTFSRKLEIGKDTWGSTGYHKILKLNKYPRNQWRDVIKEFQYLRDLFIDKMPNIDDIEVPQSWLDARKKKRAQAISTGQRKVKLQGEVNARLGESLLRYNDGKNCKFVSNTFKLEDFEKYKGITIYTEHDKSDDLDPFYKMSHHLKIRLLTFSPREMNTIGKFDIHNLVKYEEFMKGKNMTFRRIASSHVIYKLEQEYQSVFSKYDKIKKLSHPIAEKIKILDKYVEKYHEHSWGWNSKGYDAVVKVAEEYNLFDTSIHHIYLEMKEFLDTYPFINVIAYQFSHGGDKKWIDIMRDMFKYHGIRMDYTNYKLNGIPMWIPKEEENNN